MTGVLISGGEETGTKQPARRGQRQGLEWASGRLGVRARPAPGDGPAHRSRSRWAVPGQSGSGSHTLGEPGCTVRLSGEKPHFPRTGQLP